jgi:hypothetical protein
MKEQALTILREEIRRVRREWGVPMGFDDSQGDAVEDVTNKLRKRITKRVKKECHEYEGCALCRDTYK